MNFQEKRPFDPDLEMQQAFQVFDRDGSGYIDAKEIRVTMHELGVVVTSDDVAAMLQEAGVQLDGRLYYNGKLSLCIPRANFSCQLNQSARYVHSCL